ncbi:MAG: Nif3-like dinuclear metal center hexameric protein [Bacteroidia bacterium]|nr:Nif3-like dinuclear metal center hexameric protein [Bacteroidia bacterium]
MTTIKDVIEVLEDFAPPQYQESYDNSGLIVGDPNTKLSSILVCLDSIEEVIDEAITLKCNLVVAHHPIIFQGLKRINGANYIERTIIKAIKNDIAIYAIHTNLDNVKNGVNKKISDKLGLLNTKILSPKASTLEKLVTFIPNENYDAVLQSLFDAGAGAIGNYSECSFTVDGQGTFKGNEFSEPQKGQKGKREMVQEKRVELIFDKSKRSTILKALFNNHPYEEVAYDIYPISNQNQEIGSGMIGDLSKKCAEIDFLKDLKSKMTCASVRHTELLGNSVTKVAVCGGSGSFLLETAKSAGAQVFVTADFKYHQFFDSDGKILIADIGHFESEHFTIELIAELLEQKFSNFGVRLTRVNTNPVKYL